ncbi:MAG TPA: lipopolysaccharide heptosyltransferase II [Burkholderiales bacterium]|nr:lipopolysaccharide heptosyltransferase II [Burkholderiales bacterium]
MRRTLVVAPNWIGDALMAQPLLARLKGKRPGVAIDVLAPDWVAPVVRRMPEVDEVIVAPFRHGALQLRERWRLGRALRGRYDQAIVLPNTWKSALVPFVAEIAVRSGYVGESRFGLLNLRHRRKPSPMAEHYARLSEPPGAEPAGPLPAPALRVSAEEIRGVSERFGLPPGYVALAPGAEYGPAKRWPYFAELSRKLDLPAVIVGSKNDLEAARNVGGTNLVGKTSLDEAIVVIAGARAVVSNDSGLMHVAAALGRPQVAIFGSSSPQHTPPQSSAARVLWLRIECSPCFRRECPLGHFRCMRDISVEQVLRELPAA